VAEKITISKLSYKIGRKTFDSPDYKANDIKHIEVVLSNKDHFCIEIDKDGDISITSNSEKRIKVVGQEENELVFKLIK